MGNQQISLPEGPAGKALREMTGPEHIPITENFWMDLLKVQLPGIEQAAFFDRHYEHPDELDGLVREAYFLRLVATNEQSGNFRTFLRFWARLLHYYRTSPRDAKPCGAASILSLTLLCRCLVKQFAGTFTAPELIFQLEQAPCEAAAQSSADASGLAATYRGRRELIRPASEESAAVTMEVLVAPFCEAFPEDAAMLRDPDRCAVRVVSVGEIFAAADLGDRAAELGDSRGSHDDGTSSQELVLCPGGIPRCRSSVVRSCLREFCDFLVSSSFGAVNGASPSLLQDSDAEDGCRDEVQTRNLSVAPLTLHLQVVLLEILLSLAAVAAPRYASASLPPPTAKGGGLAPAASRSDFTAPFLYTTSRMRAPATFASVATATGLPQPGLSVSEPEEPEEPEEPTAQVFDMATPENSPRTAGRTYSGESMDGGFVIAPPLQPGERVQDEASDGGELRGAQSSRARAAPAVGSLLQSSLTPAPAHRIPRPPELGEPVQLPFLAALLEVLEEDEDEDCSRPEVNTDIAPATSMCGPLPCEQSGSAPASPGAGFQKSHRAAALLATLLNCVWLEPHAASLPRPPREVVRLLSGLSGPSRPRRGDAANDVLPAAADEKAAARACSSAAQRLTSRAVLVLLLLLFYQPQERPLLAAAFAGLSDPHLDASSSMHTALFAPLNFTELLKVVLNQLSDGLYPILLYCLVQKNEAFRQYCFCRTDADELLVPMLEVLNKLPSATEGQQLQSPPVSATALLLCLLVFTADRGFCESASRATLADSTRVLGKARPLQRINAASLLVTVMLRLAQWNLASCRDAFFNQIVSGILGNLARHGVERVHWYTAGRLLELGGLCAKTVARAPPALRSSVAVAPQFREAAVQEKKKVGMAGELLREIARLLSSCLRVPNLARNSSLIYALLRNLPTSFGAVEDEESAAPLRHVQSVAAWFHEHCAEDLLQEEQRAGLEAELEAAAPRIARAVDALAFAAGSTGPMVYEEVPQTTSAYFLPAVWRAAAQLLPTDVCWSRQIPARK